MNVTVVVQTARKDPKLEWIYDELVRQVAPGDRIELLVIDFFERDLIATYATVPASGYAITVRVAPPKPTIWQGRHRVTSTDWWATASTRNTAICLATHEYLVFMDDRSKLGPKWADVVRRGWLEQKSVVVGSYEKLDERGGVGHDHRRQLYPHGKEDCGGQWCYGCSIALPLAWCLEVNGFEEGCEGVAGEDYMFGLMLANAGHRIDFDPELYVVQDRTIGSDHGFKQEDPGVAPNDKSHAALARFGKRARTEFTPDLRELRAMVQAGQPFPIPDPNAEYRDWFDGRLINGWG
jgi:hypothetical protein